MAAGLQAGRCEVLMLKAFQRRIAADRDISEESVKKGVHRWREEIWDGVAGGELYSQMPLPFWRAA